MYDLEKLEHHPAVEEIAEVLCARTEQSNARFFRIITTYFLSIMASCMRAKVTSPAFKDTVINNYVVALAPSGFGKGKSTGCLEHEIMADFFELFKEHVMHQKADANINRLASHYAAVNGTDPSEEYKMLWKEFKAFGHYQFMSDGGSEAAWKDARNMLLMADAGSLNLMIDEIGSNLTKESVQSALATYLELYDQGRVKNKLTKNAPDNKRARDLSGRTPTNMLAFGTDRRLLDGSATEKEWERLLETGYARRCLFAIADVSDAMNEDDDIDAQYERMTDSSNTDSIEHWKDHFASLADIDKFHWNVDVPVEVDKEILAYQRWCKQRSKDLGEFDEMLKAEMVHRYYRVIKIAGIYAFIDESFVMTHQHVQAAVKLVEESGACFREIVDREPVEARLARYIAGADTELTHSELLQKLPFYKAENKGDRKEMLTMATAWGYKNNIILKRRFQDDIEFISGEALRETDLDAIRISYSDELAYNYLSEEVPFTEMHRLMQAPGMHWLNHHLIDGENGEGHRHDDKIIPGFNAVVIDVDDSTSIPMARELLKDYVHMIHTTKSHTEDHHRFRIVIPMNYHLELDKEDYRVFMQNLCEWLPFAGIDPSVEKRAQKWQTAEDCDYWYVTDGELLDVLPFVPRTSRNQSYQDELRKQRKELGNLDNVERYFASKMVHGNRNNHMIRYALMLQSSGLSFNEIEGAVLSFNRKLSEGLPEDELQATIMRTVAQRMAGDDRDAA